MSELLRRSKMSIRGRSLKNQIDHRTSNGYTGILAAICIIVAPLALRAEDQPRNGAAGEKQSLTGSALFTKSKTREVPSEPSNVIGESPAQVVNDATNPNTEPSVGESSRSSKTPSAAPRGSFFVNPGGAGADVSLNSPPLRREQGDTPRAQVKKGRSRQETPVSDPGLRNFAENQLAKKNIDKAALTKNKKGMPTIQGATPSVMLPLQEAYQPLGDRPWRWALALGLTQKTYHLARSEFGIGPQEMSNFGAMPSVEVGAGLEMTQESWTGTLQILGSYSQAQINFPTGRLNLPVKARLFGYGVEPSLKYQFESADWRQWQPEVAVASLMMNFNQSSSESELVDWTQTFAEFRARVSLNYEYNQGQHWVASVQRHWLTNESLWSLAFGGRWAW